MSDQYWQNYLSAEILRQLCSCMADDLLIEMHQFASSHKSAIRKHIWQLTAFVLSRVCRHFCDHVSILRIPPTSAKLLYDVQCANLAFWAIEHGAQIPAETLVMMA